MRFSVSHACKTSSGRCGEIWALQGASDAERFPTPMCLLYTRAGSVPHLTYDMLHKIKGIDQHPALFPLPPIASFANSVQEFGAGISKFSGMPTHPSFIRVQDPMKATLSGFNDKAGVSIWDQGGRVHLNVPSFMRIMEAFKPSCYQALCDSDTPKDASKKRLRRAVERTTSLLDQCIAAKSASSVLRDTCILGSVVGGFSKEHRHASVMEISKRDVDGYVIEGFHVDGPSSKNLRFEEVNDLLGAVISFLPEDKPRFMHGVLRPEFILKAALNGVDVFDASFANAVTDDGMALSFRCSSDNDLASMLDRDLLNHQLVLDLKDSVYRDQFVPLLDGCTCYACRHFTRAYVNHLLNTGEMLAYVLLNLHNIHHFLNFFEALRKFLKERH